jgi:hypothetical protein
MSRTVAPGPKLASQQWSRDRVDDISRQHGGLGDRGRNERRAMNNFNPQRSLTLGQVEIYLLSALALAGVITKAHEALAHTSGDFH